jgi:hypothetical protein
MPVDEKEEEKGKTEVEESNSKSSSPERLKWDEAVVQANVNIPEDQELKILPDNEEEEKVVEIKDAGIKSLPRKLVLEQDK